MESSQELDTPRSGRKKKTLLAKMAMKKIDRPDNEHEDPASTMASRESLREHLNGDHHNRVTSPESSSLTQVSIDQSPIRSSRKSLDVDQSETRTLIVEEGISAQYSDNQVPPRPKTRRRLSSSPKLDSHENGDGEDYENSNFEEVDILHNERLSEDLSSGEEEVVGSFEHSVQVHREKTPRNSFHDENLHRRPVKLSQHTDTIHQQSSLRRINSHSSDSDDEDSGDRMEMKTQYENLLASSPKKTELTEENLKKKDSEDNSFALLKPAFLREISITRSSRSHRLNNMNRSAARSTAMTPDSDKMSSKSSATQSSLPQITMKSVRERSFLVGSMGSSSLVGNDELERLFPDRKIKIFVVTWNVFENSAKNLPRLLNDILLPEEVEYMPDICVVLTQESCSEKREWEIRLQETIGSSHVLYYSTFHGDLHTCVFMRRDIIWYCTVPEESHVTCRPAVRTKGSQGVAFDVFGTSFLFLNSHFISGDGKLYGRIEDYKETISKIKLPSKGTRQNSKDAVDDVTARFDVAFWGGDMNFRIDRPRHIVDTIIKAIQEQEEHPDYEELLLGCELYRCKNEGLIFEKFQEGRINFPPSYKYDVNVDHKYDTTPKMRIPSYCDRILFRSRKKQGVVCLYYQSMDNVKVSDHHPVAGMYEVELRPGKDSSELSAGRFDREVYVEANRRRALFRAEPQLTNHKKSSICTIS